MLSFRALEYMLLLISNLQSRKGNKFYIAVKCNSVSFYQKWQRLKLTKSDVPVTTSSNRYISETLQGIIQNGRTNIFLRTRTSILLVGGTWSGNGLSDEEEDDGDE